MTMRVAVLGGGGFGRSLALAAARAGNSVVLYSREERAVPAGIEATRDLATAAHADILFVAVPSPHVLSVAHALRPHLDGSHRLVHVSRGLVGDGLVPITRLLREETAARRIGVLAGPLVQSALATGAPSGAIVGSLFPEVAHAVRSAIGSRTLRIYQTDDVVGVEVASALVGMLALAAGFVQATGAGPAALGVMCTRGIAEAQRVGHALGAREKTFTGLAGFGDLLAATSGDDRPEIRLGRALAKGMSLEQAAREAGAYIEGVTIARRVADFAQRRNMEAPIAHAIGEVVGGKLSVAEAIDALMMREARSE